MKSHRFFLFTALLNLALFAASCTKESLLSEEIAAPEDKALKSTAAMSPDETDVPGATDPTLSTTPEGLEEGEVKFTDPTKSTTPVGLDEDRQGSVDPIKTDTPVGIDQPGDGPKPADIVEVRYQAAGKRAPAGSGSLNDDSVIADPVHPKVTVIKGEKHAASQQ